MLQLTLGKKLQENLSDYENIEVLTFESFINKLGISYDDLIDNGDEKYKLKDLDKDKEIAYLKNALENAIVEADEIFQFNTLIIDESQDISEEFWDFLLNWSMLKMQNGLFVTTKIKELPM